MVTELHQNYLFQRLQSLMCESEFEFKAFGLDSDSDSNVKLILSYHCELCLCRVVVLAVMLAVVRFDLPCGSTLKDHVLGYIVILSVCALMEGVIAVISMRGSILDTDPRNSMQYLLYIRLGELDQNNL